MHCNGSPHVPWYAPQRPQRQTPLMKEMAMLIKRQWRWCKTKKYLCPSCVGWFPTEGPHIGKSNNTTKVPSIGNLDLLANIVSSSYLFRLYPTSWSTDGPNKSLRNWLPLKIETRQRPEIWFDANTGTICSMKTENNQRKLQRSTKMSLKNKNVKDQRKCEWTKKMSTHPVLATI